MIVLVVKKEAVGKEIRCVKRGSCKAGLEVKETLLSTEDFET